ncbi:metalloregulator ArsR/SmtB family transcription factor [Citrobacter sp. On2M]|nr:metalloregulator ArsR/SmtB family transcription factor [Citrobacter sp. On2M]
MCFYACDIDFVPHWRILIRKRAGGIMSFTSLQLFKNLSDETRLGIVLLLREMGELCVCDLCTALDQSQPKISRHLAMLRESGLLLDRKQGKWVHYRLSPHIPSWAAQVIEQAWLSQQDDVQAIASKLASANYSGSGKAVCI